MSRKHVWIAAIVVIAAAAGWWFYKSHAPHNVVVKASGADACKFPNVLVTIGHEGKATQDGADHVNLPWQSKTYVQHRGDSVDVIVTGMSECTSVQCQISVDGVEQTAKTAPRQVSCEVTID